MMHERHHVDIGFFFFFNEGVYTESFMEISLTVFVFAVGKSEMTLPSDELR